MAAPRRTRRITIERIETAARAIDPVFLHTPREAFACLWEKREQLPGEDADQ